MFGLVAIDGYAMLARDVVSIELQYVEHAGKIDAQNVSVYVHV